MLDESTEHEQERTNNPQTILVDAFFLFSMKKIVGGGLYAEVRGGLGRLYTVTAYLISF